MRLFFLIIFLISDLCYAQNLLLRGEILDSESGEGLGFANIRVAGTHYGTSANSDGEFRLALKDGSNTLIFSYLGYRSDTLNVYVSKEDFITVLLKPQSILLPEVVVDEEDPAYKIIREAIKRKEINRRGLRNFEYDAYTRKLVKSAGEVALIEETFIKGYNKAGEWEKEFVKSVFRTENIKEKDRTINLTITNSYFVDFSKDTLSLFMNLIYLPLANSALDFYDYKLLSITVSETYNIYEIMVIPKSSIRPLLEGTIWIDSRDYALNRVSLVTNEGVRFPYVNNLRADFKQRLAKTNNYWLPLYVDYRASLDINLQGLLRVGTMEFNQFSSITNYIVNGPVPDSIESAQRSGDGSFKIDTSRGPSRLNSLSSHEIDSLREIPLSKDEVEAYGVLDSTRTIDKLVKVEGPLTVLMPDSSADDDSSKSFISESIDIVGKYLEFRNNRVAGLLFGLKYTGDLAAPSIKLSSAVGYSFQKEWLEGYLGLGYIIRDFLISEVYAKYYRQTKMWQSITQYPDIINSLGVTLGVNDHFNYFLADGFNLGIKSNLYRNLSATLEFSSEKQRSLRENKYYSIFYSSRGVRVNPDIKQGIDNSLALTIGLGKNPFEIQVMPENGLLARLDFSSPIFNSDFNFRRLRIVGMIKSKTFFEELFISPYLQLLLDVGIIKGTYGPQHIFTPGSRLGFYAPFGTLKGIGPYQFAGTEMISAHLEHNWRSILFQGLGLDFLSDLHIDVVTGISGLKIWNSSGYLSDLKMRDNVYWEMYLGVSRIFALSRIDFSYSSLKKFQVSASIGVIL